MPKATATKYTLKELTELMVKDQGIKTGLWMIQATFSWAVTNVHDPTGGPSGPGALSVLSAIGIQESAEPSPFTIDAAEVWKPERRRRKTSAAKKRA